MQCLPMFITSKGDVSLGLLASMHLVHGAAVIRYNLEFLGLCPCMVDVEIIDAKAGGLVYV